MPLKEFSNSVKAKLYDFTYTPFLSSMVIAWIILNHKYILIYMSSLELEKKLDLLKEYKFTLHTQWGDIPYAYNILLPILFGLFYTFVYPFFAKFFYKYTLNKSKILKEIKVNIEDSTPITKEESTALKSENYSKTEKISELEERISVMRTTYEQKLTTIADESKAELRLELEKQQAESLELLKTNYDIKLQAKIQKLENDYENSYQELLQKKETLAEYTEKLDDELNKLRAENKDLLKKVPSEPKEEESAERKILRFFYEENYKRTEESIALDSIVKYTQLKRPKAQQIINQLIEKKVLERSDLGYLSITASGNNALVQIFDK